MTAAEQDPNKIKQGSENNGGIKEVASIEANTEMVAKEEDSKPDEQPLEEQLEIIEKETEANQQEVVKLTESIAKNKAQLAAIRKELGLPDVEENSQDATAKEGKLEQLREKHEAIERQKEELISKQEREGLIKKEKEKILQERVNVLFSEFEDMAPEERESVRATGKKRTGEQMESHAMGGVIESETAMTLAEAFKEGVRLLPGLIKKMPELLQQLHQINEELTKQAEERVDKKIEEKKEKVGLQKNVEEQQKEGEIETGEAVISIEEEEDKKQEDQKKPVTPSI